MFIIEDKIISTELFSQKFVCNLSKCKGACCWEGDFGAPVTDDEENSIDAINDKVLPLLSNASKSIINEKGVAPYDAILKRKVTPLHADGACVYLTKDSSGVARCVFEKLWEEGKTDFQKPISCHLYPIRISENKDTGFEALNYDEWEICKPACSLGEEMKMPVFRFLEAAIVRQYGQGFYDQLEDMYVSYFS